MGAAGHCLYHRLWPSGTGSNLWHALIGSWVMPPLTGSIKIEWGGEKTLQSTTAEVATIVTATAMAAAAAMAMAKALVLPRQEVNPDEWLPLVHPPNLRLLSFNFKVKSLPCKLLLPARPRPPRQPPPPPPLHPW